MAADADRAERWSPPDLDRAVACVTGASYGAGRGVAEVLGECGARVYVTGRSTRERPSRREGWSVDDTAELVRERGGQGIPVAVLAADSTVARRSGATQYAGDVAREYAVTDIDGRIPAYEGGELR